MIIVPVLLLFVMLTVDVGRAYFQAVDAAGAFGAAWNPPASPATLNTDTVCASCDA